MIIMTIYMTEPEYAYMPPEDKVVQVKAGTQAKIGSGSKEQKFDLSGYTGPSNRNLDPSKEGIIDDAFLRTGREAFYKETFGNEVFLTDIMGIVNGPLTIGSITKAILKLQGEGTTNLRVELAKDAVVGGKKFKKGELVDTGIDVPKGAYAPLGMPVKWSKGKLKVGVSCAACHASVDSVSKNVIEGAPNRDLNAGLLMGLATNSTAYFTHAQIEGLENYLTETKRKVTTSTGKKHGLPDPEKLEDAVDSTFLKWPRGNFDSTIDMVSNPAQIPDSFTKGDHPYGWSGFATAGPFHGLSAFSNNVHAQNSDSLGQAENSSPLFGIDQEVYLGTILQNAANPKFRYDPKKGKKPSSFFTAVDPTPGVPGINEMVQSPSFPKLNLMAPDGLLISSPGFKVGEQVNAMSAWQNRLEPPPAKSKHDPQMMKEGRRLFQSKCMSCHAGRAFTNNRIMDARGIGTEPSRAQALKKTGKIFGPTSVYSFDTPVPIPKDAKVLDVPIQHLDPEQIKLGFAHGNSPGGYKVKGLIGLYWSAPYLHDGGVAVGPDIKTQLGIPGTIYKGIEPDPANSLRALVDRRLRKRVIEANHSVKALRDVHVQGIGHEYWADEDAGVTKEQQDGLIQYLLNLTGENHKQRNK
ncbi:mono/diheme cytochrome c family protein [Kroppenstedtia sanguinis]